MATLILEKLEIGKLRGERKVPEKSSVAELIRINDGFPRGDWADYTVSPMLFTLSFYQKPENINSFWDTSILKGFHRVKEL